MAWRRFLQLVATRGPLILVIEDLHWADPAMLEFLEQLLDQAGPADLLVVVTARPELLDRHPGWGTGRPNATTVSLAPLDDERTAALLGALLGQSLLPARRSRCCWNELAATRCTPRSSFACSPTGGC
jgi:predicted ATPase